MTQITNQETWTEYASCRGLDPELFYPAIGDSTPASRRAAIRVCRGCLVQLECLNYAMQLEARPGHQARHGIWGGLTPNQRETLAKTGKRPR